MAFENIELASADSIFSNISLPLIKVSRASSEDVVTGISWLKMIEGKEMNKDNNRY